MFYASWAFYFLINLCPHSSCHVCYSLLVWWSHGLFKLEAIQFWESVSKLVGIHPPGPLDFAKDVFFWLTWVGFVLCCRRIIIQDFTWAKIFDDLARALWWRLIYDRQCNLFYGWTQMQMLSYAVHFMGPHLGILFDFECIFDLLKCESLASSISSHNSYAGFVFAFCKYVTLRLKLISGELRSKLSILLITLFCIPEPFIDLDCLKAELDSYLIHLSLTWCFAIVTFVDFIKSVPLFLWFDSPLYLLFKGQWSLWG